MEATEPRGQRTSPRTPATQPAQPSQPGPPSLQLQLASGSSDPNTQMESATQQSAKKIASIEALKAEVDELQQTASRQVPALDEFLDRIAELERISKDQKLSTRATSEALSSLSRGVMYALRRAASDDARSASKQLRVYGWAIPKDSNMSHGKLNEG